MTAKCFLSAALLSTSAAAIGWGAAAQEGSRESVEDIDEIVVQGIRQSLASAADAKRADTRIIDAIVAEDIGKLPDNNVAEALQRVTGVAINRDFGVGSSVSIRGLPQNRVEINGRSTLGDGRNGINFQDVPAEILGAVEVAKSPTPKMIEGALGGTINLKTLRPLELSGRVLSVSAKAEYTDKTDNVGPILNGTFGDTYELDGAGRFGIVASLAYQDRKLREDEYRSSLEVNEVDLDGPMGPDGPEVLIVPLNFSTFIGTERRERLAGNVALQWAPASEQGMVYLETTFTDRNGWDESFSPNIINNTPLFSDNGEDATAREIGAGFRIDDTRQLVGWTDEDARFINRTESGFRNTESISAALGGEWTFGKLTASAEASYADSDTFSPYTDLRFWAIDPVAEAADPTADNFLEAATFYDTDNESLPIVDTDESVWFRRDAFAFRRYEILEDEIDNTETALRFDLAYEEPFGGLSFLRSIDAGVRTTNQRFKSSRDRLFVDNIHTGLTGADGDPAIIYMNDFPEGTIQDFRFDAFRGDDAPFDLDAFAMFDPSIVRDLDRTRSIVTDLLAGTNKAISDDNPLEIQLDRYSRISEDTLAAYLQAQVDTEIGAVPVRAVLGTRWVETQLETTGFERVDGVFAEVRDTNEYDDWLPSFNLTVEPAEGLLVRFAAAKVMRRPDFDQVSPALVVNQDSTFGTRGNPQLEPFRATQYDVSVERYWGEGNLVSAALFYKDVSSFFDETEICLDAPSFVAISNENRRNELCFLDGSAGEPSLETPVSQIGIPTATQVNGDSGSVKGFELGYQQTYDFLPGFWGGFGAIANYTYADSEDPNGRPLEDISKHTYNLTGYYERGGFGARLAYTYRSRFLDSILESRVRQLGELLAIDGTPDPTQGNSFREPIKQLDASLSYDITPTFTVIADAVNLTGEQIYDTGTSETLWRVLESDRRYTIGVRARF